MRAARRLRSAPARPTLCLFLPAVAELIAFVESHEDGRGSQLPIAVEPVLAAHVTPFWQAIEASDEPLEAVQADLAELLETVDRQPGFVGRYFAGPTPRAEESKLVMDVLFGGKISKVSDIQDKELADDVFPEQAMLDVFLDAAADLSAAPVSAMTRGYLNDLVAANAVYHLRGTYDFIATMADARTTLADVTVQSAVALSPAQKDKVHRAVAQYLPAGKEDAEVDFVVDASLSGGLVVTVDSTVIDLSAATFLNQAATNVDVTEEARA